DDELIGQVDGTAERGPVPIERDARRRDRRFGGRRAPARRRPRREKYEQRDLQTNVLTSSGTTFNAEPAEHAEQKRSLSAISVSSALIVVPRPAAENHRGHKQRNKTFSFCEFREFCVDRRGRVAIEVRRFMASATDVSSVAACVAIC